MAEKELGGEKWSHFCRMMSFFVTKKKKKKKTEQGSSWIKQYVQDIRKAFRKAPMHGAPRMHGNQADLKWYLLEVGWATLNVDGSLVEANNIVGCGGVLRDHTEKWQGGFCKTLIARNSDHAEICAIRMGMEWTWSWEKGVRRMKIQSDCKKIIRWIQRKSEPVEAMREEIERCWEWLAKDWDVIIESIYQ